MGGQPSFHQGEEYEEKYGDKDWFDDDGDDVEKTGESSDSSRYKHIVGSVYWDTSWRYSVVEVPAALLALAPPDILGRATGPFWEWLLMTDRELFLYAAQNYQTIGFLILLVAFTNRLTLDPYNES
ncbi:MAG: hypothetical protein ACOCY1_02845 [Halovenus sp.]